MPEAAPDPARVRARFEQMKPVLDAVRVVLDDSEKALTERMDAKHADALAATEAMVLRTRDALSIVAAASDALLKAERSKAFVVADALGEALDDFLSHDPAYTPTSKRAKSHPLVVEDPLSVIRRPSKRRSIVSDLWVEEFL